MGIEGFPQEVVEAVGCYVYRLIDPRNGETFYVGRGRGQRVFDHARGVVQDADQLIADPKVERMWIHISSATLGCKRFLLG